MSLDILEETYTYENKKVTFKLGKNSLANDYLMKNSEKEDWWFHLSDFPSGHCLVEIEKISTKGENPKLEKFDIETASSLIKENCKLKNHNKKLKISYLQMKFVKSGKEKGQAILLKKPEIYFI
tara:strand:- start:908 stop:1279 length:372 start_codon:yes stop_codon:yes gene_type:complete